MRIGSSDFKFEILDLKFQIKFFSLFLNPHSAIVLLVTERDHWVYLCRASRRDVAGYKRDDAEQ